MLITLFDLSTYLVWDTLSSAACVVILGTLSAEVTLDDSLPMLLGLVRLFLYGHLVSGSSCVSRSISSMIRSLLDRIREVRRLNGFVTVASCVWDRCFTVSQNALFWNSQENSGNERLYVRYWSQRMSSMVIAGVYLMSPYSQDVRCWNPSSLQ